MHLIMDVQTTCVVCPKILACVKSGALRARRWWLQAHIMRAVRHFLPQSLGHGTK